jgi:hypothetical protein
MGIEDRIDRLEKENRSLRQALSMLLAGIVGTALAAAVAGKVASVLALLLSAAAVLVILERRRGAVPGIIRAQKIEIVGADGLTRVALGETLQGDGAVATYDARGHFVAALDASNRRAPQQRAEPRTTYGAVRASVATAAAAVRASQR